MSTTTQVVLIPVFHGALYVRVDKGERWSDIEHLILVALANDLYTISELTQLSRLPEALVSEAIVRLMRAGWVELFETNDRLCFQASVGGRLVAQRDSLPGIPREAPRTLRFVIDRLTGAIFPSKELPPIKEIKAQQMMSSSNPPILLSPTTFDQELPGDIELLTNLMLDPDEEFISYNAARSWIDSGWYAKVSVTGQDVEGLPKVGASRLREVIVTKAGSPDEEARRNHVSPITASTDIPAWPLHQVELTKDDIIVGGPEQERLLRTTLENARRRVIIHSTFIRLDQLNSQIEYLKTAMRRGARVDLLWDKPDGDGAGKKLRICRELLRQHGINRQVHLHGFPTYSHAKLLFADDGRGNFFAVIGSCNWLYSGFASVEASVRLRSSQIVADCLVLLEKLVGTQGRSSSLREDMVTLGYRLRKSPDAKAGHVKARLVLGAQHEQYIRQARDDARRYVTVASHRLGGAAETQVLIPAESARRQRPVDVDVYYQQASGPAEEPRVIRELENRYRGAVKITNRDKAHAKFLCWDNDHLLITSLNWLSKDASTHSPVGEVGVYLEGQGLAEHLREQYLKHLK